MIDFKMVIGKEIETGYHKLVQIKGIISETNKTITFELGHYDSKYSWEQTFQKSKVEAKICW